MQLVIGSGLGDFSFGMMRPSLFPAQKEHDMPAFNSKVGFRLVNLRYLTDVASDVSTTSVLRCTSMYKG